LWAGGGNGGGLMRLKHRTVVTYGLESGLTERVVKAVAEESPGTILLGTYGRGLMRLTADRVKPAADRNRDSKEYYVQCILIDRERQQWIGTYDGGLRVVTGDERRIVPNEVCGGANINALFQDSRGRIWIGGSESVARFEAGQFAVLRTESGGPMPSVVGFAEDSQDHAIWAANADGLYRYADGVWREVSGPGGRAVKDTFCLRCDDDGTIWLGGADGLRRLSAGRWTAVSEPHGLPARVVGSMVADDLGYFWLGTNRGLVRTLRADLVRTADGDLATLPHQIFDLSDGLRTLDCSFGFSSSAMRDSAGKIWFATPRGVAVVDPAALRLNATPPPVVLENVTYIDGHEKKHSIVAPAGQPLVLPPGSRKLEAQFAVLSFAAPEKVVLKRRFERDGDLISADRQTSRNLQSDLLVPGAYRMSVTAANNDGVWNEEGVTFAFTVSPFFWETVWFRTGAALLALGLVGGATWRIQQNRLRHEQEKMARERALAREHALLATVLEGTSDFVAFATPDGVVSFVNPAGRRMAGLGEKEDVAKLKLADFFPPPAVEVLLNTAKPYAVKHGTWSGETLLKHRDGHEIPVSQVLVVHKNAAGELLFCSTILRDIAGPKQAEQAIRKLNATLEERVDQRTGELAARVAEVERLNHELEAFTYSVSHDLRAPLRNITGFLELLTRRTGARLDSEGERFVETVVKEAARMGRLIDDLLAFSRVGRTELTVRRVALDELVAEVREELRPVIGERSVVWLVGELPAVKGDRSLLRQMLVNLLGNAVKFTRGRAAAVIEIGTQPPGDAGQIAFFVRDNGAGFNPKYQDKLFGVFQRLHHVRDFEGTGIGLANVKRIVVRHGGRVWAEGAVDRGATFYFTLDRHDT
jgi:PAS domain S-box-containing protein